MCFAGKDFLTDASKRIAVGRCKFLSFEIQNLYRLVSAVRLLIVLLLRTYTDGVLYQEDQFIPAVIYQPIMCQKFYMQN